MLQLDILAQGYAREISETHSQGKSYRYSRGFHRIKTSDFIKTTSHES